MTSSLSSVNDNLIWFKDPSIGGRRDPLLFAQEWFQDREERNRALAIKQKEAEEKKRQDEEQAQRVAQHPDGGKLLPPQKPSTHVDSQGAAGMYPTPPDGINASAMRGPLSVDAIGSTPGDLVRTASYSGDVDMAGNDDQGTDLGVSRDSEMYDDMEDVLFGENGVTEADFSFFDEPGFDGRLEGDLDLVEGSSFTGDYDNQREGDGLGGDNGQPMGHAKSGGKEGSNSKAHTKQTTQGTMNAVGADQAFEQDSNIKDNDISLHDEMDVDQSSAMRQLQRLASPPYSPGKIMKLLLPEKETRQDQPHQISERATEYTAVKLNSKLIESLSGSTKNSFDAIALNHSVLSFDEKYSLHGRFGLHPKISAARGTKYGEPGSNLSAIPTIGFPTRISRRNQSLDSSAPAEAPFRGEASNERSTKGALDTPPEDSSSTAESDQDDDSYTTGEDFSQGFSRHQKRKRTTKDDGDVSMTSTPHPAALEADESVDNERKDSLLIEIPFDGQDEGNLDAPSDTKWYNPVGSSALTVSDFIEIAQVITDQATSRFLPLPKSRNDSLEEDQTTSKDSPLSFGECEIAKIPPQHVQVRRADGTLDLLPPGINFWETFGLSPYGGPKDIAAFCIYPPAQGLDEAVRVFSERISSTYKSCRLGEHRWGSVQNPSEAFSAIGGRHLESEPLLTRSSVIKAMVNECISIGAKISALSNVQRNVLVYIVNPFEDDQALGQICTAFYRLCQRTASELRERASPTSANIFLQIVPMSLIASPTAVIIPEQTLITQFAFEIYERCFVVDNSKFEPVPSSPRGPLLVLSQPPPQSIDFRLSSTPSTRLINENSYLHVAYSSSADGRWISASWIDNEGRAQYSASYCRGRASSVIGRPRAFAEVAREIWDTTIELVRSRPVRWQILLIKVGSVGQEEMQVWTSLADTTGPSMVTMILLSTDVDPTLPSDSVLTVLDSKTTSITSQVASYATPVSTPIPHIQSPEQSGIGLIAGGGATNAVAPTDTPLELDTDALLVDVADETWSAVVPEQQPAADQSVTPLSHGFLIKRGGIDDADPVVAMGVSLLFAQKPNDISLKDVLMLYRSLGTLARLKGIVDSVRSVIPWHVAAALKAQDALSRTL